MARTTYEIVTNLPGTPEFHGHINKIHALEDSSDKLLGEIDLLLQAADDLGQVVLVREGEAEAP